jgi:uncharacterized lipoprotein YddW (UPF0748 family)
VFTNWPTDRDDVGQDWRLWCRKRYLDFVCPMDYTENTAKFSDMVAAQIAWAEGVPCYPGIGLSVWKSGDRICTLVDQVTATRALKTGGFTVFEYDATEARDILPLCGLGLTRPGDLRRR